MDEKLRQLLDAIPERPPRSKLEPHAEVIRELRKKRRTYNEIAAFFRDHLQLPVAPSTIHDFVKARARRARQGTAMPELPTASSVPVSDGHAGLMTAETVAASPSTVEQIRALKKQPVITKNEPKDFQYDPQGPLTLKPKAKEK